MEPQKSLKSCRKTRVFARVTSRSNCKENLWFYTLPGIIFRQFWHQIPSLFWNWFWHRFLTPFWTHLGAKMAPIWVQKSTKNRSKNTSEKTSKKRHVLRSRGAPRGVSDLSLAGGRKAHVSECAEGLAFYQTEIALKVTEDFAKITLISCLNHAKSR